MKIHSSTNLTFEKWGRKFDGQICRQQVISARRVKEHDTVQVVGGSLVLEFERLLLTEPSGAMEHDIQLGDDDLERVARDVWERST